MNPSTTWQPGFRPMPKTRAERDPPPIVSLFRALRSRLVAVPKLPVTNVIAMLRCFPHTYLSCHSDPTYPSGSSESQSLMDRHPGDTSAANDATIHDTCTQTGTSYVRVLLASPCHALPCLAMPCETTGGDGTSRHHACPKIDVHSAVSRLRVLFQTRLKQATPLMTGSACFCCVLVAAFDVGTEARGQICAHHARGSHAVGSTPVTSLTGTWY